MRKGTTKAVWKENLRLESFRQENRIHRSAENEKGLATLGRQAFEDARFLEKLRHARDGGQPDL